MKVRVTKLPKTESYPCTKREAKSAFGDLNLWWIGLGWPSRHFEFDRQMVHRPRIRGLVVARAAYNPRREGWFCAYVVREDEYPPEARDDFRMRVLPHMREWFQRQTAKPDTALLGHEYLIIVWDGTTHRFYRMDHHL